MSHFLNASELAEVCQALDLPEAEQLLIDAASTAARAIACKLEIETQDADNQPGFGGLCAGFSPAHEGQVCPEDIIEFDRGSCWSSSVVQSENEEV